MAVTTTAEDIIIAAYGQSLKNKADTIATEETELLDVVNRAIRGIYAFAARINPTVLAESASVAFSSPGWARPEKAETVWRIEDPTGSRVRVVPFDDRSIAQPEPAVYQFGKIYRSAGNANDPTSGSLTFFYSKIPDKLTSITQTLDSLWIEQFNPLLIKEVAIYLAIKDSGSGRESEVSELKAARDTWAQMFVAHLEHFDADLTSRFGQVRRINTSTLVPSGALLAGGSRVG